MPTKPIPPRPGLKALTLAVQSVFKLRSGWQAACYAKRLYDCGVRMGGEVSSEGILERSKGILA